MALLHLLVSLDKSLKIPKVLAQSVAKNILLYHVTNGLFDFCLAFDWYLSSCMLYWRHCWIHFKVILSLERAKSVK